MPLVAQLPQIVVYQCIDPVVPSMRFIACAVQRARGELMHRLFDPMFYKCGEDGREILVSRETNQWVGETAEEARQKCVDWWTALYDEERVVKQHGAKAAGTTWLVNQTTKHRVRAKDEEVESYLAQGYERGKHFR